MTPKAANDIEHELIMLRPRHDGPLFHAPSDLELTEGGLKRVLIVGSQQAGNWAFDRSNPSECPCDVILIENSGNLHVSPPRDWREYDFQVVQLPLRFVLEDDAVWHLRYGDSEAHAVVFERACEKLELQLAMAMKWNREHGILTLVTNFFTPQQNPMGRLFPRYDLRNPVYVIEKLNERLERLLREYENAFLCDIDMLASIHGRRFIQDDHLLWISHGSVIESYGRDLSRLQPAPPLSEYYQLRREEFIEALWWEFVAMLRTAKQRDPVKLVVVDLDDTLWNGVQGENESVGPEMLAGWPMGIVEALAYLKKRGILLAIISKNEEEQVRKAWPEIFGEIFSLDDFAAVRINFLPKAENMAEILTGINVLPESVVFIDDNPVERKAMKSAFPEIRVLPPEHYYWRRILLWSPETQVREITEEAEARAEMMKNQLEREKERVAMSRQDFLCSLEVEVTLKAFESEQAPGFSRAFELLNKTNQFNTTGKRWSRPDFVSLFRTDAEVYTFDARDRFTAYGCVGVVITQGCFVKQFVMSCRVIGLGIELAVVSEIVKNWERKHGSGISIRAELRETEKNLACRDLWKNCGFVYKEGAWQLDGVRDKDDSDPRSAGHEHVKVSWN